MSLQAAHVPLDGVVRMQASSFALHFPSMITLLNSAQRLHASVPLTLQYPAAQDVGSNPTGHSSVHMSFLSANLSLQTLHLVLSHFLHPGVHATHEFPLA